jgi:polysaccharide export outer membrane protein
VGKIKTNTIRRTLALVGIAAGSATTLAGLSGCKRSFMDPTITGRWEHTPTIMPILTRLDAIEDDDGQLVEYGDPLPEDLIPRPMSYRIGPGDALTVTVFDLITSGEREEYEVQVDPRGMVELPQIGRVAVGDRTTEEAVAEIEAAIKTKNLVQEPLVQVLATGQRRQTFTVIGAVQSPGLYPIPRADYRALEALSAAGTFSEDIKEVFIIRQVPLKDEVTEGIGAPRAVESGAAPVGSLAPQKGNGDQKKPPTSEELMDLIDTIAPDAKQNSSTSGGSPGVMRSSVHHAIARGAVAKGAAKGAIAQNGEQPPAPPPPPMVDLIDSEPGKPQNADGSSWIFVNGKWMKVKAATATEAAAAGVNPDELITQRVIRISLKELLSGRQAINVVVRPGDVIRFPSPQSGLMYVSGQVARPGSFQVTTDMTLLRAIDSAGGLGEAAIPWRVDLTRFVGADRQATIRVDLEQIARQTQPDIFIRPGDRINVGSNFWALPVAVIRNGFRASYGFGFILDRNLSNDLIGPPPVNQFGN